MDGSPSEAIIRDNVLVWNASNSPNTQFKLQATDACQAVSMTNITISLVVCPCQNNGKCIPHPGRPRGSGLYQCNCAPGFTGDACGTNIDECRSYPCVKGNYPTIFQPFLQVTAKFHATYTSFSLQFVILSLVLFAVRSWNSLSAFNPMYSFWRFRD